MFEVIAGSGHCGTKWLATVLDQRPTSKWLHHYRGAVTGLSWENLDGLLPDNDIFKTYWNNIRGLLNDVDLGDSNSWPPYLLPEVNSVEPISRVIYLTRNGVQQLNSLATESPSLSSDPLPPPALTKLRRLYDIWPDKVKAFDEMTRWERLCLTVAANDWMPPWLRENGLYVEAYSLGDLTSDWRVLHELAPELSEDEIAHWQGQDINRKVEGGRAESTIWRKWTPEQRAGYRAVVG